MLFSDKLEFLLDMTSTSNAQLARIINVDPSMISRLRKGRRGIPHDNSYIEAMADYFSKQLTKRYQLSALSEMLGCEELCHPVQPHLLRMILSEWLLSARYDEDNKARPLLKTFDRLPLYHDKNGADNTAAGDVKWNNSKLFVYYGNEGKRRAVCVFLQKILRYGTNCTIQVSSDESSEWIVENDDFAAKLSRMITALREKGCRCQRIAASASDINYSFDSIARWLPLMSSGSLESFHYPRMRDGLYRRTIIVVPDFGALVSTSVGHQRESGATFLTLEKATVNCYAKEFSDYLSVCKPMTKTHGGAQMCNMLLLRALGYESTFSSCIQQSGSLSSITMPPSVVKNIISKTKIPASQKLLRRLREDAWHFEDIVKEHRIIDIFPLAPLEEIAAGKVPVAASQILCGDTCYYSMIEYKLHLQHIAALLKKHPNYHLIQNCGEHIRSDIIYIREGNLALLYKDTAPASIIEITESNLITELWEYMLREIEPKLSPAAREDVIARIERLVMEIDDNLPAGQGY